MKLTDYKLSVSFLENFEAMIKHFCDAKDGKFAAAKANLIVYLEEAVKNEEQLVKLYQDETLRKKLVTFYAATLDLIK